MCKEDKDTQSQDTQVLATPNQETNSQDRQLRTRLDEYLAPKQANNKCLKVFAMALITVVALLATAFVIVELNKSHEPTRERVERCEASNSTSHTQSDTLQNKVSALVPSNKVIITAESDNYTKPFLLYITVVVLVSVLLIGAFLILHKILKSEGKDRKDILEVELDLYKEAVNNWIILQKKKDEDDINREIKKKDSEAGMLDTNKEELAEKFTKEIKKHCEDIISKEITAILDRVKQQFHD